MRGVRTVRGRASRNPPPQGGLGAGCLAYYLPIDREGARLLLRVVADSYETRSLILTTNLEFSKWGTVLTDDQMAAAILDRLAHHGHRLVFQGERDRMTHALMRDGYLEA